MSKKKIGGCKKKIRAHKVSKGQRKSVNKPFGSLPYTYGAQRYQ